MDKTDKVKVVEKQCVTRTEHCYIVSENGYKLYIPYNLNLDYRTGAELVGVTFSGSEDILNIPPNFPLYCTPRQMGYHSIVIKNNSGLIRTITIDKLIDRVIYVPEIDPYLSSSKKIEEEDDDPYA